MIQLPFLEKNTAFFLSIEDLLTNAIIIIIIIIIIIRLNGFEKSFVFV